MSEKNLPALGDGSFEGPKQANQHGAEYWTARELQPLLGCTQWRRFEEAVERAITSCKQSGRGRSMHDRLDHVRGWLRKAESDLRAAGLIIAADGPYDTACYHAQQAVEKCLKALLAFASDAPIPRTHNLEDLYSQWLAALPSWEPPGADVVELTPFAVESRYDFEFWPEKEEAEDALRLAERMRASVVGAVPIGARP